MDKEKFDLPKTFIKNIAIQLPDHYKLSNSPFSINTDKNNSKNQPKFIGRKDHINKFLSFLKSSPKGVFLVTGYRGMGKTSFVGHVISTYINDNNDQIKKIPIHLTLAQSNPKEFDVLRQIVNSIYDSFEPKINEKLKRTIQFRNFLIFLTLLLFFANLLIGEKVFDTCTPFIFEFNCINWLISLLTLIFLTQTRVFSLFKRNKAHNRLKFLIDRCDASIIKEQGVEGSLGFDQFIGKIISKKTKTYPIADNKIIEYELGKFLEEAREDHYEFIFIFDELDKIDWHTISVNPHEELETYSSREKNQNHSLRNRKEAILSIITGLKNFFTTANARFVFIAGREMFDASLADIADKQSPLGSIFTYTFNIESLLKEEEGYEGEKNISSLSTAIQEFLKHQLFNEETLESFHIYKKDKNGEPVTATFDEIPFYNLVYSYYYKDKIDCKSVTLELKDERSIEPDENSNDAFRQLYFMLQAFETYLIYRSSGSPKKLIKTFQEFVTIKEELDPTTITIVKRKEFKNTKNHLYFNYNNQYRIGFINAIYRPFIIQNGRSYKLFSENTIIGIPYLFDQIFKFHPFAFSISNLEYIPEVINHNKTPSIRKDLNKVISYLFQNYIRDTDIQLFDYKFKSKTANEITFISRIFEDESAAFNFTLDESYPIKIILIEKIKELRSIHSKFQLEPQHLNPQLFSIANLNANLGDLYFFDQEFDDAINSYSDAIRPINNLEVEKMNHRDFISLVRNKLKLGLCFEKINSYEDALAFYSDSVLDIKRFFSFYLKKSNYLDLRDDKDYKADAHSFYTSSMNDLLQICSQSFTATLYIQEKMGWEGMTSPKTMLELKEFFKIIDKSSMYSGRNYLIIANTLYHHANLLYYKNTAIPTPSIEMDDVKYNDWYQLKAQKILKDFGNRVQLDGTKRQPLLALRVYLIGLDEVIRSRKYFYKTNGDYKRRVLYKDENKIDNGIKFLNFYLINLSLLVGIKEPGTKITEYKKSIELQIKDIEATIKKEQETTGNPDTIRELENEIIKEKIKIDNEKTDEILYQIKETISGENYTAKHFKYIGGFLSSIGDCILSLNDLKTKNKDPEDKSFDVGFREIFKEEALKENDFFNILKFNFKTSFDLTDVLRCYYLSALFFEKYGRISSAVLQYKKIVHLLTIVIKEIDSKDVTDYEKAKELITLLEDQIIKRSKKLIKTAHLQTSSHMINKVEEDFKDAKSPISRNEIEYNIAGNTEAREITILFESFKLNFLRYEGMIKYNEESGNSYPKQITEIINPYSTISTQYAKIAELDFYVKYLYKQIESTFINKVKEVSDMYFNENKQLFFDYIYSRNILLRTLKIYETDYMLGPAFIAYAHYSLADFLSIKVDGLTVEAKFQEDKKVFSEVLGDGSKIAIDSNYHFQNAKDHYNKAIELHTARFQYREQIKDMIFLEDDFNDNNYHFGAAIERYLMINGVFDSKIKKIK